MKDNKQEKRFHNYAVKYLDENGNTAGYGLVTLLDQVEHQPGDIVTTWNGQRIMIDYEL